MTASFYRRLLELHVEADLEPVLDDALRLVVEVTGARVGYLELLNAENVPCVSKVHGASTEAARSSISRSIIDHALVEGRTVATRSALLDSRFQSAGSVRQHQITAVLCTPISTEDAMGVLYLQGRHDAGAFSADDIENAEMLARQLGRVVPRLVPGRPRTLHEQVTAFKQRVARDALQRNEWNKTLTAKELGLGRAALYDLLRRK